MSRTATRRPGGFAAPTTSPREWGLHTPFVKGCCTHRPSRTLALRRTTPLGSKRRMELTLHTKVADRRRLAIRRIQRQVGTARYSYGVPPSAKYSVLVVNQR
jgi:hypothetical protein